MSAKVLIRPISFYFIQDDGGMFKLNVSPTSVLHPKITIRCHHLTLLYQEFGTETAVEEWLAIMRDLWQGRSQAAKPFHRTRSAGPSFFVFISG